MNINLKSLTIAKAHEHLTKGAFSAVELAEAYTKEIAAKNPELNAYLEVFDDVREQAQLADAKLKNQSTNQLSKLTGVPLAFKDNILVRGKHVSASSKILEGYRATYNATVTDKLHNAGAVVLGRTNCDEFAMGASTENSAFGVTKNPHDTSRVAGGSSGGSAASIAADMALGALGSDTGGSIRQPAALCGVVGLKPTYGGVSRHGLIALGSSLDVIGTFGKTVGDAEIIFETIRGHDTMDSTTFLPNAYPQKSGVMTIGVPWHLIEREGIDPVVLSNFKESVERLRSEGYAIRDIELPTAHYSLAVYYIIMPAEASANLARFDGVKYGFHKDGKNLLEDYLVSRGQGFGPEPRRRIMLGTYVLSAGYYDAYYGKATMARRAIRKEFEDAFASVDVIATPTTPTPAFKIGEKANDPLAMYLADIFTTPANIAGTPALSVPSGSTIVEGKNLPLAIQFTAPHGNEHLLFEIGKRFCGE